MASRKQRERIRKAREMANDETKIVKKPKAKPKAKAKPKKKKESDAE